MTTREICKALLATKGDVVAAAQLVASAPRTRLASQLETVGEPPLQRMRTGLAPRVFSATDTVADLVIDENCQKMSQYEIVKHLGEGRFGTVSKASYGGTYYALKRISIQNESSNDTLFRNELFFGLKAASLGIGPTIYDFGICRYARPTTLDFFSNTVEYGYYFILQELLDETWETSLHDDPNITDEWIKVLELHRKLLKNGINHNDLHVQNIMKKGQKLYITDYGKATETDPRKANDIFFYTVWIEKWIKRLYGIDNSIRVNRGRQESIFTNEVKQTEDDRRHFQKLEEEFFKKHMPQFYKS